MSDLRQALRMIARAPGFAATVVLILGVAIAGNTAVFSAADVLLLQPLPYPDAGRLVVVSHRQPSTGTRAGVSIDEYRGWARAATAFEASAAVALERAFNVSAGPEPVRIAGARMTASLLPLLGVVPAMGRPFGAADERPGAAPVALITDRFWTTRFQRSAGAIGSEIVIDGVRTTIVGVLPAGFRMIYGGYSIWLPLREGDGAPETRERSLIVVARTRPGVTAAAAASELDGLAQKSPDSNAAGGWRTRVVPMRTFLLAGRDGALRFLLAALAVLLLVACASVASLQLARAVARRREIATRLALGATRRRIVRQLLVEAGLLAAAGGAVALAIVAGIRQIAIAASPEMRELTIDARVLAFTALVVAIAAVAFGLMPALVGTRVQLVEVLRGGASHRRSARLLGALVAVELSASLALLVPAALVVTSFRVLRETDPGFAADRVLTIPIALPAAAYPDARARAAFYDDLLARLDSLPGVRAAAAADALPLDAAAGGEITLPSGVTTRALVRRVSARYFEALGIPLLAGRTFSFSEERPPALAAIANETLARAVDPAGALGRRVTLAGGGTVTIVGVCADVRSVGLRTPPEPELLIPWTGRPPAAMTIALAARDDARDPIDAARAALRAIDHDLPFAPRAMADIVDEQVRAVRLIALALGLLSAVALALAAAGLAGLVSRLAAERTHEIGVRMALGATRRQVMSLVARQALVIAASGLAVGLPAAVAVARLLASALWGIDAAHVPTYAAVVCALAAAAALACYAPVRHAVLLDAAAALRAS